MRKKTEQDESEDKSIVVQHPPSIVIFTTLEIAQKNFSKVYKLE